MRSFLRWSAAALLVLSAVPTTLADVTADRRVPFPGFRLADNLYYVGSKGLASYLITTPQGDILINSSYVDSVPLIKKSIEGLGFKFTDVKILLINHAHDDHDAGSAEIKRLTGARYMVMDADVPTVESGGAKDFFYNKPSQFYPPAKVDRVLHDGDIVSLGGAVLTAHKTPGHTRGNTTWSMKATDHGKSYNVVIVGSWNVNPGFRLVNNPVYLEQAHDYEQTFRVLKSLPCDLFLGAHGDYFDMLTKYDRLQHGDANAFIDPAGYKAMVEKKEQEFRKEWKRQQEGGK